MIDFVNHIDFWSEVLTCLTTFLISLGSFYAYSKTHKPSHAAFGFAFLLITIGTVLLTLFDWLVNPSLLQIPLRGYIPIGYYLGVLLFLSMCAVIAGFLTLFMIAQEITSVKTIILLYLIAPLSSWVAHEFYSSYHVMLLILVAFLFQHFCWSYRQHPNKHTLGVAISFGTLALAQAVLMFSHLGRAVYVTGHALRGISFAFLFVTLVSIFISTRQTKKARSARSKRHSQS